MLQSCSWNVSCYFQESCCKASARSCPVGIPLTSCSTHHLLFSELTSCCLLFSQVVSHSLRPHELQHAWLPCPLLSSWVCSHSCPLNQWSYPTISFSVTPFSSPSIRVFSNELALHIRWPKYWSFSFSISPSNEYSGLMSFRIDWFDVLAVQGTLKNFLQHHSSKASVLQHSVFFMVQFSHPYMTAGKTIALTI